MPLIRRDLARCSAISMIGLLLSGCGGALHALDVGSARSLLPFLQEQMNRGALAEKLGSAWWSDDAGRILIYKMTLERGTLRPTGEDGAYELVLVFDGQDRLKHHTVIKVK